MQHVMIDLETMGQQPDSAIVALGAVEFDLDARTIGRTYYQAIDLASAVQWGGTIEPATVMWWLQRSQAARDALAVDPRPLMPVLLDFSAWAASCAPVDDLCPWGNAASFDLVNLAGAYRRAQLRQPWHFRHEGCYRTVKRLYRDVAPPARAGEHHHALDDAMFQVEHLLAIAARHPFTLSTRAELGQAPAP